jgi:hypothetical protein
MIHLHDKTRHKIVMAGLLLLCLLPTCAVACWCLWRNSSWETQLAAEHLKQQLGFNVKLERLKHPRPGTEIYENLELLDAETGRSLFSCRSVEVRSKNLPDAQSQEKPTLVVTFDQPEIDAAAFGQLGRLVERLLQDQLAPGVNCRFLATEAKLRLDATVQTFSGVEAGVDHSGGDAQAAMRFQLPGSKSQAPVVVQLYRDRTTTPPQNRLAILAGDNEMPCDLLALGIPEFKKLGPKARFQGEMAIDNFVAENLVQEWTGKIAGRFLDVDPQTVQATKLGKISK